MKDARTVALIAAFTALNVCSDWSMGFLPNVKLVDTIVFSASYAFGFRVGATIAVLSELIWGIFNPLGFGGLIIPFIVTGELFYALAGWAASRIWGTKDLSRFSKDNLVFGALIAISAFFFDIETNVASAFIEFIHPTPLLISGTVLFGAYFMVLHELSDFLIGSAIAPIVILFFVRSRLNQQRSTPIERSLEVAKS